MTNELDQIAISAALDRIRQLEFETVPREVADRLADAAEEAYAAMDDPSNNFNDTGDGLLMERLRTAIDGYRKAARCRWRG